MNRIRVIFGPDLVNNLSYISTWWSDKLRAIVTNKEVTYERCVGVI